MNSPIKTLLVKAPNALRPLPGEIRDAVNFRDPLVRELASAAGKVLPPENLYGLSVSELREWAHYAAARAFDDDLYMYVLREILKVLHRKRS